MTEAQFLWGVFLAGILPAGWAALDWLWERRHRAAGE